MNKLAALSIIASFTLSACGQKGPTSRVNDFGGGLEEILSCDGGAVAVKVYPFNRRLFQVEVKNSGIIRYLNGPNIVKELGNNSPLRLQSNGSLIGEGTANDAISAHADFRGFLGKNSNELRVYRDGQGMRLELLRGAQPNKGDGHCSESCNPSPLTALKVADWNFRSCVVR